MKFNIGDKVQLISGGPPMTVSSVEHPAEVGCSWFNGDEPKYAMFHEDMLEIFKAGY